MQVTNENRKRNFLLRQEIFGATFFDPNSGKRFFLDEREYDQVTVPETVSKILFDEMNLSQDDFFQITVQDPGVALNNFSAPNALLLVLTNFCNLNCPFCLNDSGRNRTRTEDSMPDDEVRCLLGKLIPWGVQEVRFTGGEPLMVRGILDYVAIARGEGLRVVMNTNGVLLVHCAEQLAKEGLDAVTVSVDGMKRAHDRIRGKGNFERTLSGIKECLEYGILVRVNTTVTTENFRDVPSLVKFLSERWGNRVTLKLRPLLQSGRGLQLSEKMLCENEIKWLKSKLVPFMDKGLIRAHFLKPKLIETRIPLPFQLRVCQAGRTSLVVSPDMKVYFTGFTGTRPIGDLREESLPNIWSRLNDSQLGWEEFLPEYISLERDEI